MIQAAGRCGMFPWIHWWGTRGSSRDISQAFLFEHANCNSFSTETVSARKLQLLLFIQVVYEKKRHHGISQDLQGLRTSYNNDNGAKRVAAREAIASVGRPQVCRWLEHAQAQDTRHMKPPGLSQPECGFISVKYFLFPAHKLNLQRSSGEASF